MGIVDTTLDGEKLTHGSAIPSVAQNSTELHT